MGIQQLAVGVKIVVIAATLFSTGAGVCSAQLPLAPLRASGQAVFPVFEGWYKNADGTFSLSFGYFNRNANEVITVPIGPQNSITPGSQNQNQPTRFETRRHWGAFAIKVPADFGNKTATWTLTVRGETYAIPGYLRPEWQIDALEGEVGSGNTPPALRIEGATMDARGPGGAVAGPLNASVGKPLTISVQAKDDGRSPAAAAAGATATIPPMTLTWFVHQGPAAAVFGTPTARVPVAGGTATTTVTFSAPGAYVLRVRANDASGVGGAGHAQCCWTNGFVSVNVTP